MKRASDRRPRALVVGEALVDVVRRPGEDDKRIPGGSPANVALGLGRLGVATDLLTHIAPDDDGMAILFPLIDADVSLVPGSFSAPRTPTALATVDVAGTPAYEFDISWELPATGFIRIPELVHLGSYSAFVAPGADRVRSLAERARAEGALVSFDPNIRSAVLGDRSAVLARFEELASLSSAVKLSDEDAEWLYPGAGRAAVVRRILGLGARLVAMTVGADGSILATGDGERQVAAASTRVADTIGAGDSYMAALIRCLLDAPLGDLDLQRIGVACAAAAAITVGRPGADPPWLSELAGVEI